MTEKEPVKKKLRAVDGILVLDKPVGLSSNQALQEVKHLFQAAKAGHTGSLDVLASGLLPICFGQATKFSQYLLNADKTYETCAKLGIRTTTCDAEGEVVEEKPIAHITQSHIETVLEKFRGEIEQVPSMFSALKHHGQPLYKLARQGIDIERNARKIYISNLELVSFDGEQLRLKVACSKGTYIRNLVDDIGQALGCGAFVTELRRLKAGPFEASQMVTIEQLKDAFEKKGMTALNQFLLPIEASLSDLPELHLTAFESTYLLHGRKVRMPGSKLCGFVKLYDFNGRFIGVGELALNHFLAPVRLLQTGY